MSAALNLQVPEKVLDAADGALALLHARTGAQGERIALLSERERRVGLMGVAPGCAAVNEGLELPGTPVTASDLAQPVLRTFAAEILGDLHIHHHINGSLYAGSVSYIR